MQNQMKKSRGRQSTKKDRKEDVTMEVTDNKTHSPISCKKAIKITETKLQSTPEKKIKKENSHDNKGMITLDKVTKPQELQKKSESSQSNLKIQTQASVHDHQSVSNESSFSSSGLSSNSKTSKLSKRS